MTTDGAWKMQWWLAGKINLGLLPNIFSCDLLHRMLGYGKATPERGSPYGSASATDKFEFTEFSCKGNERNLLDCPLK